MQNIILNNLMKNYFVKNITNKENTWEMIIVGKSFACKVLSGNRITIPKEIMQSLNLKVGDLLLKYYEGKALVFVPAKIVVRDDPSG